MTEAEWLAGTDPLPMLAYLRGRATERKLRLFAVACARLLWDRIPVGHMREAVEAAERCADGVPWDNESKGFCHRLYDAAGDYKRETGGNMFLALPPEEVGVYFTVLKTTISPGGVRTTIPGGYGVGRRWMLPLTGHLQPNLIRDIVGNPFHPVVIDPAWLTAKVVGLAEAIYAGRAFENLPALADALEEAGCDAADLLAHCRGEGPHVRGCWAVDSVLRWA